MPDSELKAIAEKADLIVNGYAFTRLEDGFISILNLDHPDCAMTVNRSGELIDTNMDQIEQEIVLGLYRRNMQFLEVQDA